MTRSILNTRVAYEWVSDMMSRAYKRACPVLSKVRGRGRYSKSVIRQVPRQRQTGSSLCSPTYTSRSSAHRALELWRTVTEVPKPTPTPRPRFLSSFVPQQSENRKWAPPSWNRSPISPILISKPNKCIILRMDVDPFTRYLTRIDFFIELFFLKSYLIGNYIFDISLRVYNIRSKTAKINLKKYLQEITYHMGQQSLTVEFTIARGFGLATKKFCFCDFGSRSRWPATKNS